MLTPSLVIRGYRSKVLELFATEGDGPKLPVPSRDHGRVRLLLALADNAAKPEDTNIPGSGFHGLHGKPKRYALKVNRNYRLTFGWDAPDTTNLDLEDYH